MPALEDRFSPGFSGSGLGPSRQAMANLNGESADHGGLPVNLFLSPSFYLP